MMKHQQKQADDDDHEPMIFSWKLKTVNVKEESTSAGDSCVKEVVDNKEPLGELLERDDG